MLFAFNKGKLNVLESLPLFLLIHHSQAPAPALSSRGQTWLLGATAGSQGDLATGGSLWRGEESPGHLLPVSLLAPSCCEAASARLSTGGRVFLSSPSSGRWWPLIIQFHRPHTLSSWSSRPAHFSLSRSFPKLPPLLLASIPSVASQTLAEGRAPVPWGDTTTRGKDPLTHSLVARRPQP